MRWREWWRERKKVEKTEAGKVKKGLEKTKGPGENLRESSCENCAQGSSSLACLEYRGEGCS